MAAHRLIGITGYATSGKDAVGKILARHGYEVTHFGDALKDEVLEHFPQLLNWLSKDTGFGDKPLHALVHRIKPMPIRLLLQEYGVSKRQDDPWHWIDRWQDIHFDSLTASNRRVCVADVRFHNEADVIRCRNGSIWRVDRPGVGPLNNHESEQELDMIVPDLVILNEGTLDDLTRIVESNL